jgi:hypothetical protein
MQGGNVLVHATMRSTIHRITRELAGGDESSEGKVKYGPDMKHFVKPRAGSALFVRQADDGSDTATSNKQDAIMYAHAHLRSGTKYVARFDVLYGTDEDAASAEGAEDCERC